MLVRPTRTVRTVTAICVVIAFLSLASASVQASTESPGGDASTAVDDGFVVISAVTKPGGLCDIGSGWAEYVDYGEGAPGGGSNDDYVIVGDGCADGHGIKAWAWLDDTCLESCAGRYVGGGAESSVVWDPLGNVAPGQWVALKVCWVDGSNDPTPSGCSYAETWSTDG